MAKSISLKTKIVVLVALPVLMQVALLLAFRSLQEQAEAELQQAIKTRKMIAVLNEAHSDVYELVYIFEQKKIQPHFVFGPEFFVAERRKLHEHLSLLETMAAGDQDILNSIAGAKAVERKCISLFLQSNACDLITDPLVREKTRRKILTDLNDTVAGTMISLLPNISRRQLELEERTPELARNLRSKEEWLILFGGCFDLFVAVVTAFILTKDVVNRLSTLNSHAYKIAAGQPLNAVTRGSDEIASIDRALQTLSSQLQEARRKERALIENANDIIMSIDQGFRVTEVNAASLAVTGFKAQDLFGRRAVEMVVPDQRPELTRFLNELTASSAGSQIDMQMPRADNSIVDTVWSAQWSQPENSYVCIIHDITAQREAERLRQDLLQMITHDLRTPLSSLELSVSSIAENPDISQHQRYSKIALRNIRRIAVLVNDLLDIEKAKTGMLTLEKAPVALQSCFDSTNDTVGELAEESRVKLNFIPTDLAVDGDQPSLIRILVNLVANAIRFSGPDGAVTISANKDGEFARIRVSDSGPGIAPENIGRVFERFYQASGSRAAGGSGLGLTICKTLVELSQGQIGVDSKPGEGATFWITIPLAGPAGAEEN